VAQLADAKAPIGRGEIVAYLAYRYCGVRPSLSDVWAACAVRIHCPARENSQSLTLQPRDSGVLLRPHLPLICLSWSLQGPQNAERFEIAEI
jgi:hypothetical protein